jgi:multiple sugar transport system ATP-binding protein
MTALTVEQLSVQLGGRRVIERLDLQVESGEFLVLLGASGCGKSTLLHTVAGLQAPHAGRVLIDGVDRTWSDPGERNVGMVFQSYALYPTLSVEGNLGLGLRARGVARGEVRERVRRVAQLLQLDALLERKPAQLSGGQRQRVAIGRALVREAGLLLLDEPLSNLDAGLRATLRRELKLLHQRLGATMIHVTHDQVEALTLATRLAVMQDGRIRQLGTPDEVYRRPANRFVAGFIGSPAMNFIEGKIARVGAALQLCATGLRVDLPAQLFSAALPLDGESLVLGLRPEQIHLASAAGVSSGQGASDGRGANIGAGRVTLIEPLGSHEVVWIELECGTVAALNHQGQRYHCGDGVSLAADLETVSLFDATTGERR